VVDDVEQGRRHMNFDDWRALEIQKQPTHRLSDICKEIEQKACRRFPAESRIGKINCKLRR